MKIAGVACLKKDYVILCLIALVYLWFFFTDMYGPGLAFEELDEAMSTLQLVKGGLAGGTYSSIRLFGRLFPLTATVPYMGALQTYLLIPFFLLFGINFFALRFMNILLGLATVILTYYFLKSWFKRNIAVIASVLLLFQPCFLLFTKMGNSDSILNFFSVLALFLFSKWTAQKKVTYLYLLAFVLGIGLWTKIVFIWFIGGLSIAYGIFFYRANKISLKQFSLAMLIFLIGVSPLILSEIILQKPTTREIILKCLAGPVVHDGQITGDNRAFLNNINFRIHQFIGIFSKYDFDVFSPKGELTVWNPFPYVFLIALIFIVLRALFLKEKRVFFLLTIFLVIFVGLCFTVSVSRPKHLFFLVPLPQIILALFIARLFPEKSFKYPAARVFSVLIQGVLLCSIIFPNMQIIQWCRSKNFPVAPHNNYQVIMQLTDYLLSHNTHPLFILDEYQHIGRKIEFLSVMKIKCQNMFRDNEVVKLPSESEFYLVAFSSPDAYPVSFPREHYAEWQRLLDTNQVYVIDKISFAEKTGHQVYILYKVKRNK